MRWKRKSDCASDVFVVHLAGVKTFLLFFSRFIDKSDINAWIGKIIHIIFIIFCCFKEIRYIFWLPIHHYHLMQYRMETKKNDTNKQCRERKKYKNKQPTRIKNLYSRWMEMRWRWDENYERFELDTRRMIENRTINSIFVEHMHERQYSKQQKLRRKEKKSKPSRNKDIAAESDVRYGLSSSSAYVMRVHPPNSNVLSFSFIAAEMVKKYSTIIEVENMTTQ